MCQLFIVDHHPCMPLAANDVQRCKAISFQVFTGTLYFCVFLFCLFASCLPHVRYSLSFSSSPDPTRIFIATPTSLFFLLLLLLLFLLERR